jgi:hypothetical protein
LGHEEGDAVLFRKMNQVLRQEINIGKDNTGYFESLDYFKDGIIGGRVPLGKIPQMISSDNQDCSFFDMLPEIFVDIQNINLLIGDFCF